MHIENTSNVLNQSIGISLQWLADENNKPEYESTAWLENCMHKWWQIINSRKLHLALCKNNFDKLEKVKMFL